MVSNQMSFMARLTGEKTTVYSQAGTHNFLPSNGLGLSNCEVGWLRAESLRAEGIDDLLSVAALSVVGLLCLCRLFMSESGRQDTD